VKVHVVGLAGSGKTTLARWFSETFNVPAYDLDQVVYRDGVERSHADIVARLGEICAGDGWVTEGAYTADWLGALLDGAGIVVWLDVPPLTCEFRILKRHLLAELARSNRHPGWRKLIRFLDYTRRTAGDQRAAQHAVLAHYAAKVTRCRSSNDVRALKMRVVKRPPKNS
jgi:adenylate kinase family enzyme